MFLNIFSDIEEMSRCVDRLTSALGSQPASGATKSADGGSSPPPATAQLADIQNLLSSAVFRRLMTVHNTIQLVECFQCPPPALCTDARDLVQEVSGARICRPFRETRNRFPAWRTVTTTLFFVPARQAT
jgi:hypothetical protein